MAKAEYIAPNGTRINLEGNPKEIAQLIKELNSNSGGSSASRVTKKQGRQRQSQKVTPSNLIASLIDGGFFRKPKDLASVKVALEETGHFYPVTTLSPTLLRMVRSRQLRRIKDQNKWLYTG
jgi:hypothetical protein